jgi:hypothetical protein
MALVTVRTDAPLRVRDSAATPPLGGPPAELAEPWRLERNREGVRRCQALKPEGLGPGPLDAVGPAVGS